MRRLGPKANGKGRPEAGSYTPKLAEQALREILTDATRGVLRGAERPSGATLRDACESYLHFVEFDRRRRASTVADYRKSVRHHLYREFGETLPLERLTSERIDRWRRRLVAEGTLTPRTINKNLGLLSAILKRAVKAGLLPSNPAAAVDRQPLRDSGDFEVLSPAEVGALVRHAENETDAALFTVAAFAGLRLGELLALQWRAVDFEKRLIHVRRSWSYGTLSTPKSGRVRSVPMVDPVLVALDKLSQRERFVGDEDLVFPGIVGEYLCGSALRRRFKLARDAAGLKPLRLHDLRHTFGTLAAQVFAITDVKAYLGHADLSTTMRYVHHVPQHDAAEKLSRLVAEATAPALVAVS